MYKFLCISIAIVVAIFLFSTCKTSEKTIVSEVVNTVTTETKKDFEAPKTITYLPPPADSITQNINQFSGRFNVSFTTN
jgi:hypothetical protein